MDTTFTSLCKQSSWPSACCDLQVKEVNIATAGPNGAFK